MITKKRKVVAYILVFSAFLVYFSSEFILRQGVVSKINPASVSINSLLSYLTPAAQDKINHRILIRNLKNSLADANTLEQRLQLMNSIAELTRDEQERLDIYNGILREHPNEPEAYKAYIFFMYNDDKTKNTISFEQFRQYLENNSDQVMSYNALILAYNKFYRQKPKPTDAQIVAFLSPLMDMEFKFRDFTVFYEELAKYFRLIGDHGNALKARERADEMFYCQSINDYIILKMEAETRAEQERIKAANELKNEFKEAKGN